MLVMDTSRMLIINFFYSNFLQDNRVHIGPKIEMRVVILGLDEAGKTSILFKLKENEFITTIPTIGKYTINSPKNNSWLFLKCACPVRRFAEAVITNRCFG